MDAAPDRRVREVQVRRAVDLEGASVDRRERRPEPAAGLLVVELELGLPQRGPARSEVGGPCLHGEHRRLQRATPLHRGVERAAEPARLPALAHHHRQPPEVCRPDLGVQAERHRVDALPAPEAGRRGAHVRRQADQRSPRIVGLQRGDDGLVRLHLQRDLGGVHRRDLQLLRLQLELTGGRADRSGQVGVEGDLPLQRLRDQLGVVQRLELEAGDASPGAQLGGFDGPLGVRVRHQLRQRAPHRALHVDRAQERRPFRRDREVAPLGPAHREGQVGRRQLPVAEPVRARRWPGAPEHRRGPRGPAPARPSRSPRRGPRRIPG